MKILILCTGNSCRSQIAEGYLKSLDPRIDVTSAGTSPAAGVHPMAIAVMNEIGLDLSGAQPKPLDSFLDKPFDYVITVCDHARETCPVFTGPVLHRLHMGFEDPADAIGTDEEITEKFRKVRDEIKKSFGRLYQDEIVPRLSTPPL